MLLSEHFALEEFTVSETAARHGIDNTPTQGVIENLRILAQNLENVRLLLDSRPIIITSGYRSPHLNAAVKGHMVSAHVQGLAADFICPGYGSPLEICRAIERSQMTWDQLIHEFGAWAHFAIGGKWRRESLTICPGSTWQKGIHSCAKSADSSPA